MSRTELHLHIPLDEREDLNDGAIQGELFANADSEEIKRGYRGTVASKVAGITYRQLDYWARKQIVEPSITPSHGSGSRRLYSFKDVVILAVSKKLSFRKIPMLQLLAKYRASFYSAAHKFELLTGALVTKMPVEHAAKYARSGVLESVLSCCASTAKMLSSRSTASQIELKYKASYLQVCGLIKKSK